MKHILIVASQTAGGEHLKRLVKARIETEPSRFTLLVPASPPEGSLTWTEGQLLAEAHRRMDAALPGLASLGAGVNGAVGDRRPLTAIDDFLRHEHVDEIVVSTFPPGVSKWLRQDLPHRIRRTFDLPVTHVTDEKVHATA